MSAISQSTNYKFKKSNCSYRKKTYRTIVVSTWVGQLASDDPQCTERRCYQAATKVIPTYVRITYNLFKLIATAEYGIDD